MRRLWLAVTMLPPPACRCADVVGHVGAELVEYLPADVVAFEIGDFYWHLLFSPAGWGPVVLIR